MVSALTKQRILRRDKKELKKHFVEIKQSRKAVTRRSPKENVKNRPVLDLQKRKRRNNSDNRMKLVKGVVIASVLALLLLLSATTIFSLALSDVKNYRKTLEIVQPTEPEDFTLIAGTSKTPALMDGPVLEKKISLPYVLQKGDSIYSISKKFNISYYDILIFNKIIDPVSLKPGERIFIPQGIRFVSPIKMEQKVKEIPSKPEIRSDRLKGTAPLKVSFFLDNPDSRVNYIWHLEKDKFAYTRDTSYTFSKPGNYDVFLLASLDGENISNILRIEVLPVVEKPAPKVVPQTGTKVTKQLAFIVLEQKGDILDTTKYVKSDTLFFPVKGTKITQSKPLLKQTGDNQFTAIETGYAQVTLTRAGSDFVFNLFVSPYPTKHAIDPPFDWYKTQLNTGFNGNCGPACVAMAIEWAGKEKKSVKEVRTEIGYPIESGAISFYHMIDSFKNNGVSSFFTSVKSVEDLKKVIDRGNIAIIVFHTGKISSAKGKINENFTDRYYEDTVGHYVIVKGYTLDNKYFVVYDPIPGDWGKNAIRYGDGVSMIGKNRYYKSEELMNSLKSENVLEIARK